MIDSNNITSQMSLSGMKKQAGACKVVLRTPSMTCVKFMTYESVFTSKLKTMGSLIFEIKRSVLVRTWMGAPSMARGKYLADRHEI